MCLAVPGEIISIEGDALSRTGRVRFGAIVKDSSLAFLPEAAIGDYVLVHAGIAISKVNELEAQKTLSYLEEIGELET